MRIVSKKCRLFVRAPLTPLVFSALQCAGTVHYWRTEPDPSPGGLVLSFVIQGVFLLGTLIVLVWVRRHGDELRWVKFVSRGRVPAKRAFLIAERDHDGGNRTVELWLYTLSEPVFIERLDDDAQAETKIRRMAETLGVRCRILAAPPPGAGAARDPSSDPA
ncbi:MAG: hypothetical protein DIU78_012435 [Pseudomonadota bacterium]|nr:MAG: hypothetical protein DIU78_19695 [Pseudomonadota bacterium]